MFCQILLSPQVKQIVIISIKYGLEKSQNFIELQPSRQPPSQNNPWKISMAVDADPQHQMKLF